MGNTEIRDLGHAVAGDQDIMRFNITVHDSVLVRRIQSHAHLDHDRNSYLPVQMSILQDHILDRNTLNVFLYHIAYIALCTHTEHMDNIGMRK